MLLETLHPASIHIPTPDPGRNVDLTHRIARQRAGASPMARRNNATSNGSAPLLTADQVGERFGVSGATVRRWARQHLIESIVMPNGRIVRFTPEAVDAFAERLTQASSRASRARSTS